MNLCTIEQHFIPPCARLSVLEAVISAGLETFYAVGRALAEIRDSRLYRRTHDTFESYCRERWRMAGRTAHQTIRSAATVTLLEGCDVLPVNESVARVLSGVPTDDVREIWTRATADNPSITAEALKRWLRRAGHHRQNVEPVICVECPNCSHVFVPRRPETASRGNRCPSRGLAWALRQIPAHHVTAVDYGCGRFRNADLIERRFGSVAYVDTPLQCARVRKLAPGRKLLTTLDPLPAADCLCIIAVLHILPSPEAMQSLGSRVVESAPKTIIVETPRGQPYYRHRLREGVFHSREGGVYRELTDVDIAGLFPGYRLVSSRRVTNNAVHIYAQSTN